MSNEISTVTRCWNCSHEYNVSDVDCPMCKAANANVDFNKAREEMEAKCDVYAAGAVQL